MIFNKISNYKLIMIQKIILAIIVINIYLIKYLCYSNSEGNNSNMPTMIKKHPVNSGNSLINTNNNNINLNYLSNQIQY